MASDGDGGLRHTAHAKAGSLAEMSREITRAEHSLRMSLVGTRYVARGNGRADRGAEPGPLDRRTVDGAAQQLNLEAAAKD